jgi:hypothetical protein
LEGATGNSDLDRAGRRAKEAAERIAEISARLEELAHPLPAPERARRSRMHAQAALKAVRRAREAAIQARESTAICHERHAIRLARLADFGGSNANRYRRLAAKHLRRAVIHRLRAAAIKRQIKADHGILRPFGV